MGVTIPDTQDYGTPVPRASTGVQSYAVSQPIQQDVAAWTYAANSAKAAADSDAAVMKETAAAVEKWSVSLDTTAAQDALNQLRGQRQELTSGESGFMRVEGGKVTDKGPDGLTMFESYPQKLQSGMEAIGGKLSSPRAQKMFREAAAAELLGYKGDVSRHGLKQTEVYQGAVYKETQEILANRVAASNDPAETDMLLNKMAQAARDRANVLGLPGEAAAETARSDGAMLVIQKAINTGDSAAAQGALTKYGTFLDAKDRIRVDGLVKTMEISDTAANNVKGMVIGFSPPPDPKDAPGVVKHFEGLIFKAKVDTDGQYRVGYGSDTVTHPDGTFSKVKADTVVTKEDAERDLARRLPQFQAGIKERIGSAAWDALSPEAKASATSIAYNYGSIPNRLIKSLQSGDPAQIAEAIRGLSGDNGRINARRRGLEAAGVGGASGQGQLTHDGLPARQNKDGSYSTEVTITVADQRLNEGKPTNIPSLWGGKEVSEAEAIELAVKSGKTYVGFDSVPQAVEAAKAKSVAGGAAAPQNGPDYKDTRVLQRQVMDMYDAMTLDNQRRNPTNEKMRSAEQQRIELWKAGQERQIEKAKLDLELGVDEWMTKGGNVDANGKPVQNASGKWVPATERPPAAIWNQLHYEKQKSIDATLVHNAKGVDPAFTPDAKRKFMELSDMATNDPDKFRDIDLNDFVPVLPTAQILTLQTLKNQIQKAGQVEYDTKKATSMADRLLGLKGVDMRPSGASDADVDVRQKTHAELLDWIARYQAEKKRKPTDTEVQGKLDDMLIIGRTTPQRGFLERQFSRSEPKAFVGPPNAKGAVGDRGSNPGETFKFMVSPAEVDKFFVPHDRIPSDKRKEVEVRIRSTIGIPKMNVDGTELDDEEAMKRLVEQNYAKALAFMNKQGQKK